MARPFIPIPNCVKVEMRYVVFGQKIENVFYWAGPNPWQSADATLLGAELVTWAIAHVLNVMPNTLSLNSIKITDMSEVDGFTVEYTTGLPHAGAQPSTGLPLNVTAAVKLKTDKRGRNFTGRNFWPAMLPEYVSGNQLQPAGITAIKGAYEALMALASPGDTISKLVVASFVFAKALRAIGVATPVTSIALDTNTDSQRRRLTGRGQ